MESPKQEEGEETESQEKTEQAVQQTASSENQEEEKEEGDAKYLRLAADFQNYKRRVEKEKSEIYAYANEKIALDIIEVMDNFERALQHSRRMRRQPVCKKASARFTNS